MNANSKSTVLDRALADARLQGMDAETISALCGNVKDGLMTVHQRESGDFIWRATDAGLAAIAVQS